MSPCDLWDHTHLRSKVAYEQLTVLSQTINCNEVDEILDTIVKKKYHKSHDKPCAIICSALLEIFRCVTHVAASINNIYTFSIAFHYKNLDKTHNTFTFETLDHQITEPD